VLSRGCGSSGPAQDLADVDALEVARRIRAERG
jgi:hypothetical protein